MTEELKPCPLDGKEVFPPMQPNKYSDYTIIDCVHCGLHISAETREEAITKWNKRPPTFQPIDTLPNEYLHNEKLVMIKLAHGVVSAWFEPYREVEGPNGREGDGGMWIALDDDLQFEMDSVTHWAPMMEINK